MTAPPAIELDHLTRTFGKVTAVNDLSLVVPTGSIFGFLGPNGAGKSTALGILAGLDFPTSGTARILGHDVVAEAAVVRSTIGYLPDVPRFYSWMTAPEALDLMGRLFNLPDTLRKQRIEVVLDLAGLTGVNTPVGGFSRGMTQRLGIAQALINAPPVLLLDEPTSALDPLGRRDVLDIIGALAGRVTVFFSSHILSDVERVCDQIAILDKGEIKLESSMADLLVTSKSHRLLVEAASEHEATQLAELLRPESWASGVEQHLRHIDLTSSDIDAAQHRIPALVSSAGLGLRRFEIEERSLEDVFVDLVRPESS
ncbi:MAG: ABC transporter ATP-binding protein [Thermomicrobiales bacterium]|nr:ABC transporter ATP-binding protein [Thermomicrobiales bacterium]